MYKIVKTASNQINIYNKWLNKYQLLKNLSNVATIELTTDNKNEKIGIAITDANGIKFYALTESIIETQLEPNEPIKFEGDTYELFDLLTTSFFTTSTSSSVSVSKAIAVAEPATVTESGSVIAISNGLISSTVGTVVVSAVDGTDPTLDVVLQVSVDNGENYTDLYHLPRITTAGVYSTPLLNFVGLKRWSWTIKGTGARFDFKIVAIDYPPSNKYFYSFYDRTANFLANLLNAKTDTYLVENCKNVVVSIDSSGAVTPADVMPQYSFDGDAWVNALATSTTIAASKITVFQFENPLRYVRLIVTKPGNGQTFKSVHIYANS